MAGYVDPTPGYMMLIKALNDYKADYDKRTEFKTYDWSNIFDKDDPETAITLSKYSEDNPYLQFAPTGKEWIKRKPTAKLLFALEEWEKQNAAAKAKAAQDAEDRQLKNKKTETETKKIESEIKTPEEKAADLKKKAAEVAKIESEIKTPEEVEIALKKKVAEVAKIESEIKTPEEKAAALKKTTAEIAVLLRNAGAPYPNADKAPAQLFIKDIDKGYGDYLKGNPVKYNTNGERVSPAIKDKNTWIKDTYGFETLRKYNAIVTNDPNFKDPSKVTNEGLLNGQANSPGDKYLANYTAKNPQHGLAEAITDAIKNKAPKITINQLISRYNNNHKLFGDKAYNIDKWKKKYMGNTGSKKTVVSTVISKDRKFKKITYADGTSEVVSNK